MEEESKSQETEIDDDEIQDFKKVSAFCKRNHYQIIAVGMLVIALAGMWFCYKIGFVNGATIICENSNGVPLLKDSTNIKDGQCLVKYDSFGDYNNNLGLSDMQVMKFEEGIG